MTVEQRPERPGFFRRMLESSYMQGASTLAGGFRTLGEGLFASTNSLSKTIEVEPVSDVLQGFSEEDLAEVAHNFEIVARDFNEVMPKKEEQQWER